MSDALLEWHLIYCLVVAGKSAQFANEAVARLRALLSGEKHPIRTLAERLSLLRMECPSLLRTARTGNYQKLARALRFLRNIEPDLRTCSPQALQHVPGIGPKTARFFVVWTRPIERYAVIDRHVLRWLGERGYEVPSVPPTRENDYVLLERAFLAEADAAGKTPRELDLEIWGAAATAQNVVGPEDA